MSDNIPFLLFLFAGLGGVVAGLVSALWFWTEGIPKAVRWWWPPRQVILVECLPVYAVRREGDCTIVELLGWDDVRIHCDYATHLRIVNQAENLCGREEHQAWLKALVNAESKLS